MPDHLIKIHQLFEFWNMLFVAHKQINSNNPIFESLITSCNELNSSISQCNTKWVECGFQAFLTVQFRIFVDYSYFCEMTDTSFAFKDQKFFKQILSTCIVISDARYSTDRLGTKLAISACFSETNA